MKTPNFVPQFALEIEGQQVPSAFRACITSVRLQSGMKGADRLEFALFNEYLRWIDHDLIESGREVQLRMGYAPDKLDLMFKGKIVGVQASFPSSGTPALQVVAQDALVAMQKGQQTRWFTRQAPNTTNQPINRTEVIRSVLSEYGMEAKFDPESGLLSSLIGSLSTLLTASFSIDDPSTPQRGVDLQMRSSDYDLLRKVASELGYDMFMDHQSKNPGIVLLFGSWNNLATDIELHYGKSLSEFSPRESEVGQIDEVTANVWISSQKQTVSMTLSWDWESMWFKLRAVPGKSEPGTKGRTLIIGEPLTLATAPKRLVAELLPKLNSKSTATGSAIGNPRIRPGTVIKITGVGERFGGFHRVTECTHSLDSSGYRTQFELRKEIWFNMNKSLQGAVRVQLPSPMGKTNIR